MTKVIVKIETEGLSKKELANLRKKANQFLLEVKTENEEIEISYDQEVKKD